MTQDEIYALRRARNYCYTTPFPPVTIHHTDRQAKYVHGPRLPAAVQANRFEDHSCWGCHDGEKPCRNGHPNRCDLPHARND